MSAAEPSYPGKPPVVGIDPPAPIVRDRSAWLGIVTFMLAVLVFLIQPALNNPVNTAAFLDQASTISGTVIAIQRLAVLGVLVLALIAALTRRGTGWAVSVISITLAGNSYVRAGFSYIFDGLFRAIFATPTVLC